MDVGFSLDDAVLEGVVFKMGRSTGPTVGTSHGCRVVEQHFHSAGSVISLEHVVLGATTSDGTCVKFAGPGDSGALVYTALSKGFGIVTGCFCSQDPRGLEISKVTSVLPLEDIFGDIHTKLDAEYGRGNFKLAWLDFIDSMQRKG